jgi:hypothetical protein
VLMGRRCAGLGLAAAMAVWGARAAAADPAPSNYEMVRGAAYDACTQALVGLRAAVPAELVALRGVGTSGGNFLAENALQSALTTAGVQVRTAPDSLHPIVEFEVVDLSVMYPRSRRAHWYGGGRMVEREARARLFIRVLDPGGARILWADRAEAWRRDEVHAKQLRALEEEKPVAYDKPVPPATHWNKVLEPIVVTGIVAGLIVLFFSNQQTN